MNLNDLLSKEGFDPKTVIVLRHRPFERQLAKVFPWLAAERPELFNAFQQTHGKPLENAMTQLEGVGHIASFIGDGAGKATFVGLYKIGQSTPLTKQQYWDVPAHKELKAFGMAGFTDADVRTEILQFDLSPVDFYSDWKGKMAVKWPPPERSWWRRAHRNVMPIHSILEDSAFVAGMPTWEELNLTWTELAVMPERWKSAMRQWRAIYFIFDETDAKGYVGSAYGVENLLGRWLNYAASGHGGNKHLKPRDPENFRFTILQRVAPDMASDEVIRLEASWKERLHTRAPFGLNDN